LDELSLKTRYTADGAVVIAATQNNAAMCAVQLELPHKAGCPESNDEPSSEGTVPAECGMTVYLRSINRIPQMDERMAILFARQIRKRESDAQAVEARNQLATGNLRLVVNIARKYKSPTMPVDDLIGYGNIGLIKAAERFEPRKGANFRTFATFYIRGAILTALAQHSRSVRLPRNIQTLAKQISRMRDDLTTLLGRKPDDEPLAGALGISTKQLQFVLEKLQPQSYLNQFTGDESDTEMLESVPDPRSIDEPEPDYYQLNAAVASLAPRPKQILCELFGLCDSSRSSIEDLAVKHGITQSRIRQIVTSSLRQLRRSQYIRTLVQEWF
jgi:RNA polymerase primary sigma factor